MKALNLVLTRRFHRLQVLGRSRSADCGVGGLHPCSGP